MIYSLQNQKDLQNAMGFVPMYGMSPGIPYDMAFDNPPDQNSVSHFISLGEKDSSNILKTIEMHYVAFRLSRQTGGPDEQVTPEDAPNQASEQSRQADFYVLENRPLNLLRSLVAVQIMAHRGLSVTEKVDIFADFFGNFYIVKRTKEVLRDILVEFERLFAGDSKTEQSYSETYIVAGLKYKERDQLAELLREWLEILSQSEGQKEFWEEGETPAPSNPRNQRLQEQGLVQGPVGRAAQPRRRGLRLGPQGLPRPARHRLSGAIG